jgi:hypothetical protein
MPLTVLSGGLCRCRFWPEEVPGEAIGHLEEAAFGRR